MWYNISEKRIKKSLVKLNFNNHLAGVAGVEPTLTVLETVALPLNYTPKTSYIIHY